MNQEYVDTVRLLLAIAPAVFQSPRFALKGGTALNLFLHEMPRPSVDIDVVFTDHALGREDALRAIAADLKAAKTAISALGYRASLPTTKSGDDVKLFVEDNGLRIKVEVNFVFRGTVLPVTQRPLMPIAQELFTSDIVLPVLDPAELYGGKLVAALDRQHPRDVNGGADKNLDYLEVVHVLVRRQDARGRALHQAGQAREGDYSAIGLSDQERVEGLVPGTRA